MANIVGQDQGSLNSQVNDFMGKLTSEVQKWIRGKLEAEQPANMDDCYRLLESWIEQERLTFNSRPYGGAGFRGPDMMQTMGSPPMAAPPAGTPVSDMY